MGFGREARRVRDLALPVAYRRRALGVCVHLAQPIGFAATWSYLEAELARPSRAADFLLPALDLLEAEHRRRAEVDAQYAQLRLAQKRAGLRIPPRTEATPRDPRRWHGDERAGARHALAVLVERSLREDEDVGRHPHGRSALAAVDALAVPVQVDTGRLQAALDWARHQLHVIGWESDRTEHRVAWTTYRLLGQLHLITYGAPALGRPWNFA